MGFKIDIAEQLVHDIMVSMSYLRRASGNYRLTYDHNIKWTKWISVFYVPKKIKN